MKKYFFAAIIGLFILSSCEVSTCINKSYFITTYDKFIEDFEKGNKKYSLEDWNSKEEKMKSFVNDCYASFKEDMTAEEKVSFWTKYVEFMIIRYKGEALTEIESQDRKSEVEVYKEIKESLGEVNFEKLFKDIYGDDIEKAVDDVLKELNKWGDQLKEWLDNK